MPSYISNPSLIQKLQTRSAAIEKSGPPVLGFVLDRSESMNKLADEALAGFNALLNEQRNLENAAGSRFSLSLFNNSNQLLYDDLPIAEVPALTRESYAPGGGTALNDAIGSMIQTIGKRASRSTRVLVAILTDGEENCSHSFSIADIASMIAYRRLSHSWQFIFIGPHEAGSYALSIGIPKSNVVSFTADATGITDILAKLSRSMKAYQLGDQRYALKLRN